MSDLTSSLPKLMASVAAVVDAETMDLRLSVYALIMGKLPKVLAKYVHEFGHPERTELQKRIMHICQTFKFTQDGLYFERSRRRIFCSPEEIREKQHLTRWGSWGRNATREVFWDGWLFRESINQLPYEGINEFFQVDNFAVVQTLVELIPRFYTEQPSDIYHGLTHASVTETETEFWTLLFQDPDAAMSTWRKNATEAQQKKLCETYDFSEFRMKTPRVVHRGCFLLALKLCGYNMKCESENGEYGTTFFARIFATRRRLPLDLEKKRKTRQKPKGAGGCCAADL